MTSFQQAERHRVRLPQGTVSYRELGTGEPIVFVHGFLVDGSLWRKVAEPLAADFRCIVPDWPLGSHREAMDSGADLTLPGLARIVADFLDALDLQDVTLVGNDSGGAICQLVVTRHPERIGRLVLTPCDAYENCPPGMFKALKPAARVPGLLTALLQPLRIPATRRTPLAFGLLTKRPIPAEVLDAWVTPVLTDRAVRRDAFKFVRGLDAEHTLDAAAKFGAFDRPVLLAWATEDRLFPMDHAQRMAVQFPHARVERIDDSRTFVSEDQPGPLIEAIRAFVREPVGAAA